MYYAAADRGYCDSFKQSDEEVLNIIRWGFHEPFKVAPHGMSSKYVSQ